MLQIIKNKPDRLSTYSLMHLALDRSASLDSECCLTDQLLSQIIQALDASCHTKVKLQALNLIKRLSGSVFFRGAIRYLIAPLSDILHDHSLECRNLGMQLLELIYSKVDNRDLTELIPYLLEALLNPETIPVAIDMIASTTFVQSVDPETLSVITPILLKTFRSSTNAVKRQTIVIIENMTKLVDDAYHALGFIDQLLPIVEFCKDELSEPEVREVSAKVYAHLLRIQEKGKKERVNKDRVKERVLDAIDAPGGPGDSDQSVLLYLVDRDMVTGETLSKYLPGLSEEAKAQILRLCVLESDSLPSIDALELCNCEFTLGYGSKVLLHKARLHIHRGIKYGLIGSNNSGKSTLMRSMATGQLESFPTHLKSVYVETDILGDLSHLSLVDYILQDERLSSEDLCYETVKTALIGFGFTESMLTSSVSTLSGGWRMKLALSRAMIQNADILLMDEPSAHLDVINVKWLLDYIKGLKDVTCIIVSQNAQLLDECCTHILHIDNLKLHLSEGNLSSFVKTHPEASSYFELKSDKYTFQFPKPRFLPGVKSAGKAVMKMENVTFTYPGTKRPIIKGASVQVSLSSRIGCLGPNGAGKSTSIKLLTGQLVPDTGNIWTYAGVKVGYIAQHAFVHIEQHLDKTPNEYIRWRYEGGQDKEELNKVTQIMTDEDIAKLDTLVYVEQETERIKCTIKRLTYGRRVCKKDREYEVETAGQGCIWLNEDDLIRRGYQKLLKVIDSKNDAAEGTYRMALTEENVQEHLGNVGLSKENATHVKIKNLSNGEKVKVVIGTALWSQPHILILDEPTNNIDRDGLGALCAAINDFAGGVIIITHDEQFCNSICKEIWVIEDGILNVRGDPDWMKNAVVKIKDIDENEMVDAQGNITKVKQVKKKLSRREQIVKRKRRQRRIANGEEVSSSDSD